MASSCVLPNGLPLTKSGTQAAPACRSPFSIVCRPSELCIGCCDGLWLMMVQAQTLADKPAYRLKRLVEGENEPRISVVNPITVYCLLCLRVICCVLFCMSTMLERVSCQRSPELPARAATMRDRLMLLTLARRAGVDTAGF